MGYGSRSFRSSLEKYTDKIKAVMVVHLQFVYQVTPEWQTKIYIEYVKLLKDVAVI